MQWLEWPEWTPEKEARYRWLLNHIETCRACNLRPEDDDSVFCAAMEAHLDGPPAVRGALSGAVSDPVLRHWEHCRRCRRDLSENETILLCPVYLRLTGSKLADPRSEAPA